MRAYTFDPDRSRGFLEQTLGFRPAGPIGLTGSTGAEPGQGFESRGERRGSFYVYDEAPGRGIPGAGTVHHVAWGTHDEEHELDVRKRVLEAGAHPTPVIDRFWFRSVYFREPSGVLFELATIGPGFATDEAREHLGESLSLPPAFEHLRGKLEQILTPLPDPRRDRVRP